MLLPMTIKKVVEHTGRSQASIYNLLAAGLLDAVKDGKRTMITGESLERHFSSLPPVVTFRTIGPA